MKTDYRLTKYACYAVNMSMSVVATLSPLLFLTFHDMYGISYSLLGTLVLVNFCTQLLIDLIFSFYSQKFNITKTVRFTPVLTALGMLIYAAVPLMFPGAAYAGLVAGTVIFAASGGLVEVLISPVIAAIPADNPEREMSKLHSVYAWGVVGVVIITTLMLAVTGRENWQWLALGWMLLPVAATVMFFRSPIPELDAPESAGNTLDLIKSREFLLCFFCIFLGGASECTMSQWSSSYLEQALGISKVWGDVGGVAMFALMLGLGRTLYARFGKKIYRVLLAGSVGATACYAVAAISNAPLVGLAACALTGFCVSMLWPGSLLVASDKFPAAGVAVFALMAAGGDLGGSVGPQIVGLATDVVLGNGAMAAWAADMGLTIEQMGMKVGLVSATVFPLVAAVLYAIVYAHHKTAK